MAIEYQIFSNTGAGDPINYASPTATVTTLTWTSSSLKAPGTWSFGVRAVDTVSGLVEENLDCAVTLVLGTQGNDITNQPSPPWGLRAIPLAGGAIQVEWFYPTTTGPSAPTGFYVYSGTGGAPNYAAPAATVSYSSAVGASFVASLSGLAGGVTYAIGVRAYNATGTEQNTNLVNVTAVTIGPTSVDALTATATALA